MPPPICDDGPSSIVNFTSTRSGRARDWFRLGRRSMYGRRCRRSSERVTAAFDSTPPSSWRISRRRTSSLVFSTPRNSTRRTYVRAFGSIWNVSAISFVCRVDVRHGRDFGEREAVVAEPVAQRLFRGRDQPLRIHLARLDAHVLAQDVLRHHEAARELHRAHVQVVALVHVDRDEQVVLLGRQRDLRRGDLEIRIAAVHVIGADLLEVALQGFARILVVAAVERQQVRRLELGGVEQFVVAETLVAHHVDLPDARALVSRRCRGSRRRDCRPPPRRSHRRARRSARARNTGRPGTGARPRASSG